MKIVKKILNIVYWIAIVALVVIAASTAFSVIEAPGGFRSFVIQSGSMEPTIKTGSLVFVIPKKDYKKGDIITFLTTPNPDLRAGRGVVTHRIYTVQRDENRVTYKTKGDANEDPDRETINKSQVIGKRILSLPYLGYLVVFSRTQLGFILLIVVPGTLVIWSEVSNLKKEVAKLIKEKKKTSRESKPKKSKKKSTKKTKKKKTKPKKSEKKK